MNFTEVMEHFKSQDQLAKACQVSPPAVAVWKKKGIPNLRQYQIKEIINNKISE